MAQELNSTKSAEHASHEAIEDETIANEGNKSEPGADGSCRDAERQAGSESNPLE
jgi:hypothetical protein